MHFAPPPRSHLPFLLSIATIILLFIELATGNGNVFTVNSIDEFVQFSKSVSNGTTYMGSTVFLGSDIEFTDELSGQFEPIGNITAVVFKGTFDGQGHIISNLKMSSTSQCVGLFSNLPSGAAIKNVVIDDSCSFTCSYGSTSNSNDAAYVGGLVGKLQAGSTRGSIEGIVNMANVTFTGSVVDLHLGGIAGAAFHSSYSLTIKNCANYGSVVCAGTFSGSGGIGGIVGHMADGEKYIYNCINHGTIIYDEKSENAHIGGIVGSGNNGNFMFDNCVNVGEIKVSSVDTTCVGNTIGYIGSADFIETSHCYWSSNTGYSNSHSCSSSEVTQVDSYMFDNTTFELSNSIAIESYNGKSLIGALNAAADYYNSTRGYSRWALNKDRENVQFTINNRQKPIALSSQLLLLPDFRDRLGQKVDGWYTDQGYTALLVDYNINSTTASLYGRFGDNTTCATITYDTRGGSSVKPWTRLPGVTITLPTSTTREDCTFMWWEDAEGNNVGANFVIPAHDITLYAMWACTHIKTAEDLVSFSKAANSGEKSYLGTTVYLDSDIEFSEELSEQFEPIGTNSSLFKGTLDGRGHTVSNLKVAPSSSGYAGLFGYSAYATITSVVVDGSCSFAVSSATSSSYVGGIVGRCMHCTIGNAVNMAGLSFTGSSSDHSWMGGIVGDLTSDNGSTVKNCVNYGAITHSGSCGKNMYLGGIAGESFGKIITNCANYGTITVSGTAKNFLVIGGIVGNAWNGAISNCLSAGRLAIVEPTGASVANDGRIVGRTSPAEDATITNCYWTHDGSYNDVYGYNSSFVNVTRAYGNVTLNDSVMNMLNEYVADDNTLSKWFVLGMNGGKINDIDQNALVVTQSHFPDPAKEGNTFLHWSTGPDCTEKYDRNKYAAVVSACFDPNIYAVAFDFGNETVLTRDSAYGAEYMAPELTKTGYTFAGWFTGKDGEGTKIAEGSTVGIASNHTIYAHFTINSYTLTFIFGNGAEDEERTLDFGDEVTYPGDPAREGYLFSGWDRNVTNMPAGNVSVTALWTRNATTFVEIVFSTKDLSKDDVKTIINKYTNDNFVIEGFAVDKNGETTVIVKFTNKESAENFVEIIEGTSSSLKTIIRNINFISELVDSFTTINTLSITLFISLLVSI